MKSRFVLPVVLALGCGVCAALAGQRPRLPAPVAQLHNVGFEEQGSGVPGWSQQGDSGSARIVRDPVASGCRALELTAGPKGSSGASAFQVFQVLDVSAYRGTRVEFGARVRTRGAAANITLYTPDRFANDFYQNLQSDEFLDRVVAMEVPATASFLSYGIQVMGAAGGRVYIDDAFVSAPSSAGSGRPPAAALPASDCERGGGSDPQSASAEVQVNPTTSGHTVSPLLLGMHLEWAEAGNGLVDSRTGALRRDVLDVMRPLRPPLLRFPGGIHADYYDWQGGVAPVSQRPEIENVFKGQREPQLFASPEFVALLKATGAQALVTANYGTGSPEQAAAWAKYFKDAGIDVPYWEVGNEIYLADRDRQQPNGRRIARSGQKYAEDFPAFQRAIKGVFPDAKVGLIGHVDDGAFPLSPATSRSWTAEMLATIRPGADFMAVHNAYAPVIIDNSGRFDNAEARGRAYKAMFTGSSQTAENLAAVAQLIDQTPATRGLPIAVTEWGPLFGYSSSPDVTATYADQSRTMAAGVYVASILDVLIANQRVFSATYTNPIHRWYGSLITDTGSGLIKTPSYHVFEMYRARFERRLAPTTITTRRFGSETVGLVKGRSDVPEMMARAGVSEDGRKVTVMLVNRGLAEPVSTRVSFTNWIPTRADCLVLAAAPNAVNGPRLTATTTGGADIAPRVVACPAGKDIVVHVPPVGVVSLVAERR